MLKCSSVEEYFFFIVVLLLIFIPDYKTNPDVGVCLLWIEKEGETLCLPLLCHAYSRKSAAVAAIFAAAAAAAAT